MTLTLKVPLNRHRESCQDNLHLGGYLFLLGWVLRSSWGLSGIRGHSLGCVYFFFNNAELLGLLERVVRRERERE